MSQPIKIAPSILSADFARLADAIQRAEAGGADYIHVDVMDGHFVPNITVGPPVVRSIRRVTDLPLDIHLMITDPLYYAPRFAEAGADIITVHVEAAPHLHRVLDTIRDLGVEPGVTLNPATPAESIGEVLEEVSQVLVMTVDPGFGGQTMIAPTLKKVTQIREMLDQTNSGADLEVDGGINAETAARAVEAGANVLVVGSAVFDNATGVETAIERIRQEAYKGQSI